MKALDYSFYNRPPDTVAYDLLGKILQFKSNQAFIIETEAYCGSDDPASHAYRGQTPRNTPMFGPPGFTYIYLSYGIHYCLNITTNLEGQPGGVLIRGILVFHSNQKLNSSRVLNGPGKLTRFLGINKDLNNQNILHLQSSLQIFDHQSSCVLEILTTPRVGISQAKDLPYRFILTQTSIKKLADISKI